MDERWFEDHVVGTTAEYGAMSGQNIVVDGGTLISD